ncbi:MAG: hypothetical protein K0R18_363 [Bacillales bacterium]|jgi:hypothetical protein|nr:hypothetical protein [Bacillales bacterium]
MSKEQNIENLQQGHVIIWQPYDRSWLPVLSLIVDKTEDGYYIDTDGSVGTINCDQITSVIGITPESVDLVNRKA